MATTRREAAKNTAKDGGKKADDKKVVKKTATVTDKTKGAVKKVEKKKPKTTLEAETTPGKTKDKARSTRILKQQLEFMEAARKTTKKKKKPKTPLAKVLAKKVRRKDLEESNVLFNLSVLKATTPNLRLDHIKL